MFASFMAELMESAGAQDIEFVRDDHFSSPSNSPVIRTSTKPPIAPQNRKKFPPPLKDLAPSRPCRQVSTEISDCAELEKIQLWQETSRQSALSKPTQSARSETARSA